MKLECHYADAPRFSILIKKDSVLVNVIENTIRYWTTKDNQTEALVAVFQGENPVASKNEYIGEYVVGGLLPRPAGATPVYITFVLKSDQTLLVTTRGTEGQVKIATFRPNNVILPDEEVIQCQNREKEYSDAEKRVILVEARLRNLEEKGQNNNDGYHNNDKTFCLNLS